MTTPMIARGFTYANDGIPFVECATRRRTEDKDVPIVMLLAEDYEKLRDHVRRTPGGEELLKEIEG